MKEDKGSYDVLAKSSETSYYRIFFEIKIHNEVSPVVFYEEFIASAVFALVVGVVGIVYAAFACNCGWNLDKYEGE